MWPRDISAPTSPKTSLKRRKNTLSARTPSLPGQASRSIPPANCAKPLTSWKSSTNWATHSMYTATLRKFFIPTPSKVLKANPSQSLIPPNGFLQQISINMKKAIYKMSAEARKPWTMATTHCWPMCLSSTKTLCARCVRASGNFHAATTTNFSKLKLELSNSGKFAAIISRWWAMPAPVRMHGSTMRKEAII